MRAKLLFLLFVLSSFQLLSQQRPNEALEKNKEMIQQLQTENQALRRDLSALDKEVEVYRNDVRSTASALHDDMSDWLVILSIIMTLIGVILGVVLPIVINTRHDKMASEKYDQMLKELKSQVIESSNQAKLAVEQAQKSDVALKETQNLKEQMTQIKKEVDENVSKAEQAAKDALASQWISEALTEAKDNPEMASKLYSRAINLSPNNSSQAYNNRGVIKGRNGSFKAALKDFSKAIEIDPEDPRAFHNRGKVYFSMKKNEDALEDLDKALSIDPKRSMSYGLRGAVRLALKDIPGALSDLNTAIELDPNEPLYFYRRSIAKKIDNDLSGAMDDIDRAITLNPNNPEYYSCRGRFKLDSGMENAIEDFDKAITLDPTNAKYFKKRAQYYDEMASKETNEEEKLLLLSNAQNDRERAESLDQKDDENHDISDEKK